MSIRVAVVAGSVTRELRRAVLRPQWPVGSAMAGDDDPEAVHLAALDRDDRVVGAAVVLPRAYPLRPDEVGAWQLRGMATDPERRDQGVGALVVAGAVEQAASRGGRLLWCDARITAVRFYERHDFTAEGAEFVQTETGLAHVRMWRPI